MLWGSCARIAVDKDEAYLLEAMRLRGREIPSTRPLLPLPVGGQVAYAGLKTATFDVTLPFARDLASSAVGCVSIGISPAY